jgi:hypothetical protein
MFQVQREIVWRAPPFRQMLSKITGLDLKSPKSMQIALGHPGIEFGMNMKFMKANPKPITRNRSQKGDRQAW